MERNERLTLLKTISNIKAVAEEEECENIRLEDFLVMPDYSRLRDPARFLILGGRGSGKTRVFQMLTDSQGFSKLIGEQKQLIGPNADNTDVIIGYKLDRVYPSSDVLDQFLDEKETRAYWAGTLVILLANTTSLDSVFREIVIQSFGEDDFDKFKSLDCIKTPGDWLSFIQQSPETWENILDKIDEQLELKNRWLFVAYDSLDRLTSKYSDLFPFLRSLLSFWHTHSKRWKRLRCKIFLRNDLFQSNSLAFPDSSKLSSNTLNLRWNTVSLYRLLVKKMANANSIETVNYLQNIPDLISKKPDSLLGYIPSEQKEKMEAFVERLIGTYMGGSPKKGRSYTWAPNHLQDANGDLAPRSFLKCFSAAAEDMCSLPGEIDKLQDPHILLPAAIQGAIRDVSNERVQELQEEYPWLERLKTAFSGLTMLMSQQEFIDHIDMNFWNDEQKKTLPANSSHEVFSLLQKLGIVLIANDGRVNVPEIYLHGFQMKRKGGLPRLANE